MQLYKKAFKASEWLEFQLKCLKLEIFIFNFVRLLHIPKGSLASKHENENCKKRWSDISRESINVINIQLKKRKIFMFFFPIIKPFICCSLFRYNFHVFSNPLFNQWSSTKKGWTHAIITKHCNSKTGEFKNISSVREQKSFCGDFANWINISITIKPFGKSCIECWCELCFLCCFKWAIDAGVRWSLIMKMRANNQIKNKLFQFRRVRTMKLAWMGIGNV